MILEITSVFCNKSSFKDMIIKGIDEIKTFKSKSD